MEAEILRQHFGTSVRRSRSCLEERPVASEDPQKIRKKMSNFGIQRGFTVGKPFYEEKPIASSTIMHQRKLNDTHFIEEYDQSKRLVWKITNARFRFDSINMLENGNILASDINDIVAEVDYKTKEIINRKNGISARDAFRLPNGNTIFVLDDQGADEKELWFQEIDKNGKTIRSKSLGKDHSGSVRK